MIEHCNNTALVSKQGNAALCRVWHARGCKQPGGSDFPKASSGLDPGIPKASSGRNLAPPRLQEPPLMSSLAGLVLRSFRTHSDGLVFLLKSRAGVHLVPTVQSSGMDRTHLRRRCCDINHIQERSLSRLTAFVNVCTVSLGKIEERGFRRFVGALTFDSRRQSWRSVELPSSHMLRKLGVCCGAIVSGDMSTRKTSSLSPSTWQTLSLSAISY